MYPTDRVQTALTFLFFKVRSSDFEDFLVSFWNVHFWCLLFSEKPRGWYYSSINHPIFNMEIELFCNYVIWRFYTAMVYHPHNIPEHKRHRKWAFQDETKNSWKSGLVTLKNKKVRAVSRFEKMTFFLGIHKSGEDMTKTSELTWSSVYLWLSHGLHSRACQ